MKSFFLFFSFLFGSLLSAAPTVTVSILPQKYFVEQIAKDYVNVNVMVVPGANQHTYEPKR
jgi:zinc transport system substrate-binding protein